MSENIRLHLLHFLNLFFHFFSSQSFWWWSWWWCWCRCWWNWCWVTWWWWCWLPWCGLRWWRVLWNLQWWFWSWSDNLRCVSFRGLWSIRLNKKLSESWRVHGLPGFGSGARISSKMMSVSWNFLTWKVTWELFNGAFIHNMYSIEM